MCVAKEQTDQKTATEVQQRLVARSDSSSSSRSCSSGSFAVEHHEPRDSQGSNTQLYTPNPTRYESCCFLTECEGKEAENNALGVCCICIAKRFITEDSSCCKHCAMTKIMHIAYEADRPARSLDSEFLCVKCWKTKQLLRCYKEDFVEAHFEHIYQQLANAYHKRTAKEVKTAADIQSKEDRTHVMESIKDIQKRAGQLMLCMEMQYFDEEIQKAGRLVLNDCALLFEKPPALVPVPLVVIESPEEVDDGDYVSAPTEYKVRNYILRHSELIVPLFLHRLRYDSNDWKHTVKGQSKL